MKIEAIEVQKVTGAPALWQEIVDASRNGWIWHTWTFHEFNLCAGKQFEATDLSFFIYQDGQAVGVVPLMVQNVTLGAYTGREATGYSGPLSWPCFSKDLDPERIKELETFAFTELERRARSAGAARISFLIIPPIDQDNEQDYIARIAAEYHYVSLPGSVQVVHTTPELLTTVT